MSRFYTLCALSVSLAASAISSAADRSVTSANCSFLTAPDEFLSAQAHVYRATHARSVALKLPARSADAGTPIARRNFIDEEIFSKLDESGVRPAPLSSDSEFLRRITLDLTGRIPSPADVRDFLANTDPNKRDAVIDKLIASDEFNDKWTWWLADLLQVNAAASTFNRQINGRNAFYSWIHVQVNEGKSLKDIAYSCIIGSGNNYLMESGAANFPLVASTPMGPIQDTYDTMLSRTASAFLGLGYYDCLLCHNGRGHLTQLSVWGGRATRMDAERMAAFFSRLQYVNHPDSGNSDSYFFNSRMVQDRTTGTYDLNTTNGNRPVRCAPGATVANNRCSATTSLTPVYHFTGATPAAGRTWREAFADNMTGDPMLSRNLANRLWKQMFNLGLVDPVDTLDPARLDPANPPPDPWTLQATHPVLLEKLAQELWHNNFSLRDTIRLIAQSSAYQLSSRYPGEWSLDYVPLFARHYARRLEGEEVADAIVKATAVANPYTVQGYASPLDWAMQLPEPLEPRNNAGNALNFMNAFLRGNRDTQQRNQSGSILQQLNLMNDQFVLNRNKVAASSTLRAIANTADNGKAVEDLYLLFLGRAPSDVERSGSITFLSKATTQAARNTAVEDLAWTMINRLEFIFSY